MLRLPKWKRWARTELLRLTRARAQQPCSRQRQRNIKAYLRQFSEHERLRATLRFACGAVVVLLPFYLLVGANAAWTPQPRFFPDDAVYARMCFPAGFLVYWNDFGFYRLLAVPAYALSNRAVMRASLSPVPYTLIALALATAVFVCSCLSAGLARRRGVLLAGVLLSSPLLLETLNFWSGTFNYALVLLLVSVQLRAGVWAHGRATVEGSKWLAGEASRGFVVTACGALLALLTYEIALPFILASSAFYVRGWLRRACVTALACVAAVALVLALVAAGLYWPQRFKLAAAQLTSAVNVSAENSANNSTNNSTNNSANNSANTTPDASTTTDADTTDHASVPGDVEQTPAPPASSAPERAWMYVSLLFSFLRTGLRSPWLWGLVLASAWVIFLPGRAREEGHLPWSVAASAFAFALAACVGYLALTKSMNARYVAFLLIYGAATLAWTKGRVACYALASLLLVQAAVSASLPIHMRDVELAARGRALTTQATRAGDLVNTAGRLARASWGKRFLAPPPVDMLTRPLNPRACRYSAPCEECK
ncbi:MAG TPA: hypothetical protein VGX24_15105 [Pyrinomonadaceae bacterium]|jgi:hypothetical protein|nr:hypothetical protein [Pyrinomonadaceae bacterium]